MLENFKTWPVKQKIVVEEVYVLHFETVLDNVY